MNVKGSLLSGLRRALLSWKFTLIAWLCYAVPVLLIVIPLRGALKIAYGKSMITDKLAEGFDFRVFSDLGPVLKSIMASAWSGLFLVLIISFVLNAFITGGLFEILKKEKTRLTTSDFFSAASQYFGAFLIITILVSLMIVFFIAVASIVIVIIINTSGTGSEKNNFLIQVSSLVLIFLIIPVFLLIADNSRVIRASGVRLTGIRSLVAGLNYTFSRFWSSYFAVLPVVISQVVFGAAVMYYISAWKPVTWKGVFLLFVVSQILFYIRLCFKTWRYGTVTALMDK